MCLPARMGPKGARVWGTVRKGDFSGNDFAYFLGVGNRAFRGCCRAVRAQCGAHCAKGHVFPELISRIFLWGKYGLQGI
jgi:hypothetical protein